MNSRVVSLHLSRTLVSEAKEWLTTVRELRNTTKGAGIEKRLTRLIDAMPGMVYECVNEPSWRMSFASTGSELVTGYPASDFLSGKIDLGSLIEPEDQDRVWSEVQQAVRHHKAFDLFYRIHTASGELRWVWDRGSGVFGENDQLESLEGFICDVTGDIKMREQFFHLQKLEAVEALVHGISHEYRNLLAGIFASVDLYQVLGAEGTSPDRVMSEIRALAERAANLTDRLSKLVKRHKTGKRLVDLNDLVHETQPILEMLKPPAVELGIRTAAQNSRLQADFSQIEQVILNLVINGFEAMKQGGTLWIETHDSATHPQDLASGRCVLLMVRDSGGGVDPEVQAQIFQPFVSTKGGSGMGLPTVQAIVSQHGGTVDFSSRPGEGTTFRVFLPVEGTVH